jgi:hypothetical protein
MPLDQEFFDDIAADQMFLDDALEVLFGAVSIPDALGIHDGDGPSDADAKALRLRSEDRAFDVDLA